MGAQMLLWTIWLIGLVAIVALIGLTAGIDDEPGGAQVSSRGRTHPKF